MKQSARIAVVGAGGWTQGWHLPQLRNNPRAKIAAIVERVEQPYGIFPNLLSRSKLGEEYSAPIFDNFDDLLKSSCELDGVLVATNHSAHAEIGLKALDAGLHVFMEKPMTVNLQEAKDLAAKANASDKIFMINNTANWREKSRMAQKIVQRGDIGEIRHVNIYWASNLGWLFNEADEAFSGWNRPSGTMLGNGMGWGQLSHAFAWLFMVTDLQPTSVFAFASHSKTSGADIWNSVVLQCKNGANVSLSAIADIPYSSKMIDFRLVGTEGMLTFGGMDETGHHASVEGGDSEIIKGGLEFTRYDGRSEKYPGFVFENTDQGGLGPESLQNFVDGCCGLEYYPGVSASIGLKATASIDAMYRSIHSQKMESTLLDNEMHQ